MGCFIDITPKKNDMKKSELTRTVQLENDEQLARMFAENERFIKAIIAFCVVQFFLLVIGFFHF